MDQAVISYLSDRQCAPQWKGFLQSLTGVLAGLGSETELKTLMQQAGKDFALHHPLAPCSTLPDMAQAMSGVWQQNDWGWVQLQEQDTYLEIQHFCAPLVAALAGKPAAWMVGFLEGAYQQWFDAMEPNTGLRVQAISPFDALGSVLLRLGH